MFIPLFQILRDGDRTRPSEWLGIDWSSAPAFGKCRTLFIHETEGDYPSWYSMVAAWWQVDDHGAGPGPDLPYGEGSRTMEAHIELPKVKLTHSDEEAWFGVTCGPDWYVKIKAKISPEGLANPEITADFRG
jgi:hypothetical protein